MNRALKLGSTWLIIGSSLLAGCASIVGPSTVGVTIDMPGKSPRQVDAEVASDTVRRLFCASGNVSKVTSVSTEGSARIYVSSAPLVCPDDFVREVRQTLNDSADQLLRGAVVHGPEQVPGEEAIPAEPSGRVRRLRINLDHGKMIDAGVTSGDVFEAVAKALGLPAWPRGTESMLAPATEASEGVISTLTSIRLPSKNGFVSLGDVATIRIIEVPSQIVENWP